MFDAAENYYFCDSQGNSYVVKDVAALGDCAVLAVLCHPNFNAPLTDIVELRRAVVSFARGPRTAECKHVYSILKARAETPFELYLDQVLQPRFWVGTEFFVWATMLYGIDVRVHFFTADKMPCVESSAIFLAGAFPGSVTNLGVMFPSAIDIFFHQYKQMATCNYNRYNHFAILIPFPTCPDKKFLLNDLVQSYQEAPWWKPGRCQVQPEEEKENAKASRKTSSNKSTVSKKASVSKVERKEKHAKITAAYLGRMSTVNKKAFELGEQLAVARQKALELAEERQIQVEELDLPVHRKIGDRDDAVAKMSKSRSLTPKYCHRTWTQRAYIIYMHLHPQIGAMDVGFTTQLTGVKANTLLGWISKPSFVSCWLPLVGSIKAEELLSVLPPSFKECFNFIDTNTTIRLDRFQWIARKKTGTQLKIAFAGSKTVSSFVLGFCCLLLPLLVPSDAWFISTRNNR